MIIAPKVADTVPAPLYRRGADVSDLKTIANEAVVMKNGPFTAHSYTSTDFAGFKTVAFNDIDAAAVNKNALPFRV